MTSTDNERGLKNSQRVTLSSGNTATPSVNFVLDGLQQKPTDARGIDWLSFYQSCCGRIQGNKDPAGHGSFSNSDYLGRESVVGRIRNEPNDHQVKLGGFRATEIYCGEGENAVAVSTEVAVICVESETIRNGAPSRSIIAMP